jgi:hypothetical protein
MFSRARSFKSFPLRKSNSRPEITISIFAVEDTFVDMNVEYTIMVDGEVFQRAIQYRYSASVKRYDEAVDYRWKGVSKTTPYYSMIGELSLGDSNLGYYSEELSLNGKLVAGLLAMCKPLN